MLITRYLASSPSIDMGVAPNTANSILQPLVNLSGIAPVRRLRYYILAIKIHLVVESFQNFVRDEETYNVCQGKHDELQS
jgi:hypothetical protein